MLIEHQESRHDTADWDDIYEGVAAVLESVLDGDSRASVAVQYSDMCRVCFANAILLVIENLPHTGDLDSAVLDAKELHADGILHWRIRSRKFPVQRLPSLRLPEISNRPLSPS